MFFFIISQLLILWRKIYLMCNEWKFINCIKIFLCMLIHELQLHHLPWLNVKILIMLSNVKILIIHCIFCLKFIIKSGFILDWDKPWNLLTYTSQPTQENSAEVAQISRIIYWNNLLNTLSRIFFFCKNTINVTYYALSKWSVRNFVLQTVQFDWLWNMRTSFIVYVWQQKN